MICLPACTVVLRSQPFPPFDSVDFLSRQWNSKGRSVWLPLCVSTCLSVCMSVCPISLKQLRLSETPFCIYHQFINDMLTFIVYDMYLACLVFIFAGLLVLIPIHSIHTLLCPNPCLVFLCLLHHLSSPS